MIRQRWDYQQLEDCPADILEEIIKKLNEEANSGDYSG